MDLHLPFALHVAIALLGFGLLGHAALQRSGAGVERVGAPLIFSYIYAGQMLAWFASYLILPINAAIARATGVAIPLALVIWAAVLAFAWLDRRSIAAFARPGPIPLASLGLVAVGGMAALVKVCAVYSSNLGALGLDTHQHIYWVNQILDANYLPLVSRHTEILASYPRAFHLLVALWSAAGLGGLAGPLVKLMPFCQTWLPLLVFAEFFVARRLLEDESAPASPRRAAPLTAWFMITTLLVMAFALSKMVYPEYDLNSTPRFSSSGVFVLPYLVLIFARVFGSASGPRLSLFLLPSVVAILCAMNIVLVGPVVFFLLPLIFLTGWSTYDVEDVEVGAGLAFPRPVVLASLVIPLLVSLGDPFLVTWWTKLAGGAGELFLAAMGVVNQESAVFHGVVSDLDFTPEAISQPRYRGAGDLLLLAGRSGVDAVLGWLGTSGSSFPYQSDLFSDAGRWIIRGACVIPAGVAVAILRRTPPDSQPSLELRIWLGLLATTCMAGLAGIMSWRFLSGLAEGRSHAFVLLRDYAAASAANVSLIAMGLLMLASCGLLLASLSPPAWVSRLQSNLAAMAVAAAVVAVLPFGLYAFEDGADRANLFWSNVSESDLANLREIEESIDEWDVVLVPAAPWRIGSERWIIPQGQVTSVLPYSRRRLLFNSRLGHGVHFSWKDLAKLCNASPSDRREFLRTNDVRFVLLKNTRATTPEFYEGFRICGVGLESFGVGYPPASVAGDLVLYPIRP